MSRAISILLFLSISVISSVGQVLNARGLKVVKKAEVEIYTYDKTISGLTDDVRCIDHANYIFGYNTSNQLISLSYKSQCEYVKAKRWGDSFEKRFTLSNGKLTRRDYENGKVKKDFTFNYVLDGNIITKREVFNHDSDGGNGCLRFDTEYLYELSDDGYPQLIRTIDMWYTRLRGTNYFQKGDYEDSSHHWRFCRIDGNVYQAPTSTHNGTLDKPFRYQDYEYSDLPNDTNINWFGFEPEIGGWEQNDIEMHTEWVNVRSEHLLDRYKEYSYQYGYDNGNLSTIEVFKNGRLLMKFTITYKMD